MISYPLPLLATGGARTGIAPVNLLEVQTLAGDIHLWSDRPVAAPSVILAALANGLMVPSPPFPVPAGQGLAWALPASVSVGSSGSASASFTSTSSAELTIQEQAGSGIAGTDSAWAIWSGFDLPSWAAIPETEIVGIYPVIIASPSPSPFPGELYLSCGPGLTPFAFGGFRTNPAPPGGGGIGPDALPMGVSIGSSLSDLDRMEIGANILCQGRTQEPVWSLSVSAVGFAIYYRIPGAGGSSGISVAWSSLTGPVTHDPWLLSVPQISFHRSLQTDTGSFVVQNLSGDTLSRDTEKLLRASAFEGALFVYRLWQADAEAAWIEVHGTLSVDDVGVDTLTFKGTQLLNPSQDDTPLENYCETCQLQWGGIRCGASGSTECSYSYQTCQVIERIMVVMNDYEKNYGETLANTALNVTNRRRLI